MPTLERASELVSLMRQVDEKAAIELLWCFQVVFKLQDDAIEQFAIMCGYPGIEL